MFPPPFGVPPRGTVPSRAGEAPERSFEAGGDFLGFELHRERAQEQVPVGNNDVTVEVIPLSNDVTFKEYERHRIASLDPRKAP